MSVRFLYLWTVCPYSSKGDISILDFRAMTIKYQLLFIIIIERIENLHEHLGFIFTYIHY